ncbi:hypothetical protein BGZ76_001086 [Entomortierella beljakovae]|nr:hypothetical protein BGZ76_001086 [Entomortierella beljakovae]
MTSSCQLRLKKIFASPDGYSHEEIPDLTGKVAIVTGANTGLGYASTVTLAASGARVFMACRNKERAMSAMDKIKDEIRQKYPQAPEPKLEFLELDLNDLKKCRESAQTFLAKNLPLHILLCNSGIMATPFALSADGIETQFAVNHMGHYVFTMSLLGRIKESQPSRVVIVTSNYHGLSDSSRFDLETLNTERNIGTFTRYGRSKLANILFASALARRLENEQVYVNSVHPGFVKTELTRYAGDVYGHGPMAAFNAFRDLVAMKPMHACLTQLYLATSPEVESKNIRGKYYIPIANQILPTKFAQDEEAQEELMRFSEKLVKDKIGGL